MVGTLADDVCCSTDAAASATSKDDYETSGWVAGTALSSVN